VGQARHGCSSEKRLCDGAVPCARLSNQSLAEQV